MISESYSLVIQENFHDHVKFPVVRILKMSKNRAVASSPLFRP